MTDKKRSKAQFSLRFLFILTSLIALGGGFVSYLRTEPYGIQRIRQLGGEVYGYYPVTIKGWAEPLGFSRLQIIKTISVENDELSDADLKRLIACTPLARIDNRLRISSSRITDDGIKAIAGMTEVSDLAIDCPNVSDEGLAALAQLEHLLDLRVQGSAKVTGQFLEALSVVRPLIERDGLMAGGPRWIGDIALHGPKIDDGACQWLTKFGSISSLDLSGTQITDKGLATLESAEFEKMRMLNVSGTQVTKKAVESYRSKHPDTFVVFRKNRKN